MYATFAHSDSNQSILQIYFSSSIQFLITFSSNDSFHDRLFSHIIISDLFLITLSFTMDNFLILSSLTSFSSYHPRHLSHHVSPNNNCHDGVSSHPIWLLSRLKITFVSRLEISTLLLFLICHLLYAIKFKLLSYQSYTRIHLFHQNILTEISHPSNFYIFAIAPFTIPIASILFIMSHSTKREISVLLLMMRPKLPLKPRLLTTKHSLPTPEKIETQ